MSTNQHLDALLIGALYGELSLAEKSELDAHLLAHPADANALAQLRRTHAVVRSGGLPQCFVEPPQAVSALLLQEASRKAPKKSLLSPSESKQTGWFARFVRSFATHPALAAAASLVLVAGIGGVLYMRGSATVEPTMAPTAATTEQSPVASNGRGDGQGNLGGDSDGRMIADNQAGSGVIQGNLETEPSLRNKNQVNEYQAALEEGNYKTRDDKPAPDVAKPVVKDPRPHDGKKKYIPISTSGGPTVKDIADPEAKIPTDRKEPITLALADDGAEKVATNAISGGGNYYRGAPGRAPSGGSSADSNARETAPAPQAVSAPATTMPAPDMVAAAPVAPVTKKVAQSEAKGQAATVKLDGNERAATELAWAQTEHEKLKKLVDSNKCVEAGKMGSAIADRAPEYYQEHVANDRKVQSCMAYIRKNRASESDKSKVAKPSKTETDSR
jgi:hypothetical protein